MPDHIDVIQEILKVSMRLKDAPKAIFAAAKSYAESERDYRLALSQEITKLKADGLAVTLIADTARGNVSDLKYQRDLNEGLYKSTLEAKKALESELSGLQSVLRVQNEA